MTEYEFQAARAAIRSSGYPFQMAIERAVVDAATPWRVLASEYAWLGEHGGTGFIDLILAAGTYNLVIECKRRSGGSWIFLTESERTDHIETRYLDIEVGFETGERYSNAYWLKDNFHPPSPRAGFCVVHGQSNSQEPMLERVCRELLEGTQAFAADVLRSEPEYKPGTPFHRWVFPVLVTNCRLVTCRFDPADVDLSTGRLDEEAGEYEEVPWIRFHKTLAPGRTGHEEQPASPRALQAAAERTVFVVGAEHLTEFLTRMAPTARF